MASFSGILGKLFNVNKGEWGRISLSWFINLFYRIAFVIGWTIIVGMFVGRYGILMLPVLFVANGIFSIIGSFIYATFIGKVSKEKTILLTVLFSSAFLLLAALFKGYSETLFFALLLAAEAVFLVQLKIVVNGFVETLFTPLESERTFPFIESAETIGGIIAGTLVVSFSNSIDPSNFVYLWIVAVAFIAPCILYYQLVLHGIYRFNLDKDEGNPGFGLIDKMREVFSQVRHVSFIKGLFCVVLLQWIFANLIELQYTRAVYENVSSVALTSGSGFEHALVHDLGALFILFSAIALVFQLIVGSRLITSLGIVGSMMLYPIVMLLSVFGLTVRFGFPTAVLAQANKNITQILHMNAYHSAYYSIKEHFREHTCEFLEGVVRPVGAVLGTVVILGLQKVFVGEDLILAVNLSMIGVLLFLFVATHGLQSKYTKLACYNLTRADDKVGKVEAIDILSQKGHKSALPVLRSVLYDPKESDFIKAKILKAFGELQEFDAIDDIIKAFGSRKIDIRLAAVEALLKFHSVKSFFFKHVFYEYKIAEALKSLYKVEKNDEIRSLIIHFLSRLSPIGTFGFLINALKRSKGDLKADVILALGRYKDEHVIPYIKPFLASKNPKERASAIISLWRYLQFFDELELDLDRMLLSKSDRFKEAACYIIGELKLKSKFKDLKHFLSSENKRLRAYSALSLAQIGYLDSVGVIVGLLFEGEGILFNEVQRNLKKIPYKVSKAIEKEVKQLVSHRINSLLVKTRAKSLDYLDTKSLKYLKMLYSLVEENEEVELINELLYVKKSS